MNFSNKFKIFWWVLLIIILTDIGIWRFNVDPHNSLNIFILAFWFMLVLFPIISEVSIFGINVKKGIESAKNELKSSIADIKNEMKSYVNYQPTIFLNTSPADKKDIEKKAEGEIKEEKNNLSKEDKTFLLSSNQDEQRISSNEKMKERLEKILHIEKSVNKNLLDLHGENYKPQMKIENESLTQRVIADGLIFKNGSISEIVEIKFITAKSFDRFYFIAFNFIKRIIKAGLPIPIYFIVVSESMGTVGALLIKKQINQLRLNRTISQNMPPVRVECFKWESNKLIKIDS